MPYKRRYNNNRRPRYRKRYPRYSKLVTGNIPMTRGERLLAAGAPYAQAIPAIARTVGQFASMINSEPHYFDVDASVTPGSAAPGSVTLLTGMGAGDGDSERTGTKILGKDLYIRWRATVGNTANKSTDVRMILICDKECDGVAPSIADILEAVDPDSPINQDYGKRFVVLKDIRVQLIPSTESAVKTGKFFKKIPFHLFYDTTSSGIAATKENHLFMCMISNEPTNVPTVNFYSRFKWYDN